MKVVSAPEGMIQREVLPASKREWTAPELEVIKAGETGEEETEKKKTEEEERGVSLEISENLRAMYQEQLEAAKEAAEDAGEAMQDMGKIFEIARRISRGDKVPPSDEKKLLEYDSDLYQAAKASAVIHADKKHKKHSALFEDESGEQNEQLRELKREASSESGGSAGSESAEVIVSSE